MARAASTSATATRVWAFPFAMRADAVTRRSPMLWRDLRSRLAINVLLFALSTVAVLASVLGPLLVAAVTESTLQAAVAEESPENTSVTVSSDWADPEMSFLFEELMAALTPASKGRAAGLWQGPEVWAEASENVAWAPQPRTATLESVSRVRVIDDSCRGLTVLRGRCPAKPGQVMVSADDAKQSQLGVSSYLSFRFQSKILPLRVVGVYDAGRAEGPLSRPGTAQGTSAGVTADPLVLTGKQVAALALPIRVTARVVLREGLRTADEPVVRQSITAVSEALQERPLDLVLSTRLVDLFDRVDAQTRSAQVLVAVTEVQALGVAAFSLCVVLQRVASSRSAEWGIGRLRGVPRRRWLASIFAEPALALFAGVPVGVVLGVVVAHLSVAANLRPGTPVEVWRWPVLAATGATVATGVVALMAVSAPSVRRPLIELIQERSESRRLSVSGAVAQAAVVLLAAATLYQLVAGGVLTGRGSQLGLLAPALFALALAVLAVRVAVLVVRGVTARPPRSLTALVVGRQAARTPSSLNPAIVVAVGVALSVFATQVLLLSARNQDLRATAVTGADTVLQVAVPPGVDLVSAVNTADPTGKLAMAVQQRAGSSDAGVARIVAVDSSRLAAVTAWSPAWSGVTDLSEALRPGTDPPISLHGTRVEVHLDATAITPGETSIAGTAPADPNLTLTVDTGPKWKTVPLGPIGSGDRLRGTIPCRDGCRIVGFGLVSLPGAPYKASVTITSVATNDQSRTQSRSWLTGKGRWHTRLGDVASSEPVAQAIPHSSPAGLSIDAYDELGGNAALIAPSDVVDPLPAVLAPGTPEQPYAGIKDAAYGRGLDDQPQLLRVVGHASVLPRSLGDGVLVDLSAAAKLSDPAGNDTTSEVWLAPGAPAEVEKALTAAGLRIGDRQQLAATRTALQQQPTTRAAAVAVYLGYAALLLTLLALVAARVADMNRRRADWHSLRDARLPAATVRRLALVEIAVPPLLGTVLGLVSGTVALTLTAPRLPLVDLTIPGPPLDLQLSWPAIVLLGFGVALTIVAGAALGATLETRPQPGRT